MPTISTNIWVVVTLNCGSESRLSEVSCLQCHLQCKDHRSDLLRITNGRILHVSSLARDTSSCRFHVKDMRRPPRCASAFFARRTSAGRRLATNARPATARQHYAWVASRISTLKLCCRLAYFTWELGLAHRRGSHSSDINWASHISVCAQIVDDTIIDFEIKYNAVGLAHRRGSHSLDDNWASHISVCMLNRDEITINMGNFARGTGKELFAISDWYARATFFEILVVANVISTINYVRCLSASAGP